MISIKNNGIRIVTATIIAFAIYLLSYYGSGYGAIFSVAISLFSFPIFISLLFPKEIVLNFYGKHFRLITIIIFFALSTSYTLALYGIFGVFLLFNLPFLFFSIPPILNLLLTQIGLVLLHRIMSFKLIKEEKYPKHVLQTSKILDRILSCIYILFFSLITVMSLSSHFDYLPPSVTDYFGWFLAFVFWSIVWLIPLWLGVIGNHKETRLSLRVAIDSIENLMSNTTNKKKSKKEIFDSVKWLKNGLNAYNRYLFTQPEHPMLTDVNRYYNAVYLTILAGTKNDKQRVLKSLKNMLKALGKDKEGDAFRKFLSALMRLVEPKRLTWDHWLRVIKTFSRKERIIGYCKYMMIYIIPIVGLILTVVFKIV